MIPFAVKGLAIIWAARPQFGVIHCKIIATAFNLPLIYCTVHTSKSGEFLISMSQLLEPDIVVPETKRGSEHANANKRTSKQSKQARSGSIFRRRSKRLQSLDRPWKQLCFRTHHAHIPHDTIGFVSSLCQSRFYYIVGGHNISWLLLYLIIMARLTAPLLIVVLWCQKTKKSDVEIRRPLSE